MREWGRGTARHYQQKACEVKEMLLMMARTAESVGARDQRCAGQMSEVTERLKAIASLDDLTEIRARSRRARRELKTSIERMTAEGKAVLDQLKEQVASYQTKLEEAEELASRDALTGLSSRLYVEGQIEKRIAAGTPFCVAIIDIDGFKKVNDDHGHLTGDELLKQFGVELRSACRATDVIGRWGGDEFILLFDCGLEEAEAQTRAAAQMDLRQLHSAGQAGRHQVERGCFPRAGSALRRGGDEGAAGAGRCRDVRGEGGFAAAKPLDAMRPGRRKSGFLRSTIEPRICVVPPVFCVCRHRSTFVHPRADAWFAWTRFWNRLSVFSRSGLEFLFPRGKVEKRRARSVPRSARKERRKDTGRGVMERLS